MSLPKILQHSYHPNTPKQTTDPHLDPRGAGTPGE